MNAPDSPSSALGTGPARIGPLLRLAQRRAARTFTEALRPLGIEGRHYGVLLNLGKHGPLSQRQLIDLTGSDKSAMVRTVDDLEARGLAVRRPSPADRRAYAVEMTDEGRALFADAARIGDEVGARLLACLESDDQRLLCVLLERFVAAPGD
ncbi:MarR family winged helix-turn-helix transcriptional regulator [Streptomyces sp. NPDC015220]|uniref:MarR family winged helix-turn-helix transcriptional regulator n=1 Tax=Streptomyces sp. NPDC015220 TaxID=3364947 RepID=UPI0036FC16EE